MLKRKYGWMSKTDASCGDDNDPPPTRRTGHNHLPLHQQPQHTTTTTTLSPPTTPPTKHALEIGLFRVRRRSRQLLDERLAEVTTSGQLERGKRVAFPYRQRRFERRAQFRLNRKHSEQS